MDRISSDEAPDWREFLLLGAAIFLFYGVLLWAPLISDDPVYILRNASVAGPWTGFRSFLDGGQNSEAFEPLVVLLHRGIYALVGARPFLYRLTSLLLHWANAGLVLALFSRILRDGRLAFLAALLFAVFPAHVEVLAGSTCKKHLLVALFTLSALLLTDRRSLPAAARVGGGWILFALALACKETAVVLPALVAARIFLERRDPERPRGAETGALFGGWAAILAGYFFLRLRLPPRALAPWAGGSFLTNLLTAPKILAWSLSHLLAPWPLSIEQPLAAASWPPDGPTLISAAVAAAALGGTAVLCRRERRAGLAAAWTLLVLGPFLNLVPYLNYSLAADRYLYLASAGFFLLAAVGLESAFAARRSRRWITAALCGLAAAYACCGISYASLFADARDVYGNAARWAPRNPRAHEAYGNALARAGQSAEAAVEMRRAIALDPGYDLPYSDLATVELRLGRPAAAVAVVEELVRRFPDASSWAMLGVYRLKAGQLRPAAAALRRAAGLAPGDPEIRLDLGYAELAARRWDDATTSFRAAVTTPELRASALAGWGEAAKGAGRLKDSAALFEKALALDPGNVRASEFLADDDVALGRKDAALKVYDAILSRLGALPSGQSADPAVVSLSAELRRRREALARR
jgi:tetratricopeptide (TPR) repeat protein